MDFQMREVARPVKKLVDITHEAGKEAMMFLETTGLGQNRLGLTFRSLDWMP